MINSNMRIYEYRTYGENDAYGQPSLSTEVKGTVKMDVEISSKAVQDNILYSNCTYVGLTHDDVDDRYVIDYGDKKLKVMYVNTKGRHNQVFLKEI